MLSVSTAVRGQVRSDADGCARKSPGRQDCKDKKEGKPFFHQFSFHTDSPFGVLFVFP